MTMRNTPAPGVESGDKAHEVLRAVVLGPHHVIGEMLDAAAGIRHSGSQPRRSRQLADTFMATTCRHLAAVDDTLLPVARRHMEDGRRVVSAYVVQARELEHALHAMKARLYGEAHSARLQTNELWTRVRRLLVEHETRENEMVDGLADVLSDEELIAIARRLRATERRSPTRPHPYSPHTGLAGRMSHRVWSVFDGFWDNAEGRVIPHHEPPPHPRRDSLITRYAMGVPRFDEPGPAAAQPERRAS